MLVLMKVSVSDAMTWHNADFFFCKGSLLLCSIDLCCTKVQELVLSNMYNVYEEKTSVVVETEKI